jgi:membrane protein DedA with SNARE-associated domain
VVDEFTQFMEWARGADPFLVYGVVLLIAYVENVVPPIPGDLVIAFGGYLAAVGSLNLPVVVVLATVASVVGFMTMYVLGDSLGVHLLDRDKLRWVPKKRIVKARAWVLRSGFVVVLLNRFLPGLRSVISLAVGMVHLNRRYTVLCSTISSLAWTVLITYVGYAIGENWDQVREYAKLYSETITIAIVVIVVIQVGRFVYSHRVSRADRTELSDDG